MADFELFIDGTFTDSADGATFDTIDPSTGAALGTVARAGRTDADHAVRAAHTAFHDGRWSAKRGSERAAVLDAVARGINDRAAELADLEARDSGATLAKAKGVDVAGAMFWFKTMAQYARLLDEPEALPQTTAPGPSYNYVERAPVGVGAAIIPWNFPLQMAAWKISMALAAGNTIVLKPAPETPVTATVLAEICRDAGIPDGVVNVLPGYGEDVGAELVTHAGVDKVSFTGSVEVGKQVAAASAATVKNVTLELGGKSPQLLLPGADWDLAIDGVLYGIFFHAGQVCTAGSRLLLPDDEHDAFVERLVERARDIRVGPATDAGTTMGPVISERQLETILGYIDAGKKEGATLALGGERLTDGGFADGFFIAPTIFTDVTPEATIAREEIFGPVLSVLRYRETDDAVAIANDTDYGLAGAVWGPPGKAQKVASRLAAGTVWVNDYHLLNPKYPFGGVKQSGMGREHGWEGLLEWTETRHVHVAVDQRRDSKRWFDMTVPRG